MSARPDADAVGLVVALPAEARSIGIRGIRAGECVPWRSGWVAISGIGPHNAMRAAEELLEHGVARLANWGVAGALDPELLPGDIVIPDCILFSSVDDGCIPDPDASSQLASRLTTGLRVRRGALWSTHEAVTTREAKRELAARSHAIAVDMESAPVAMVARRAALPFVAVKAICDDARRELPNAIADTLLASDAGVSPRMLAAILFAGPGAWGATRRLAHDFAQARRALATAARLADPAATAP